jgi:RNA polymerase sigma-70 factor (ECF subfamily)
MTGSACAMASWCPVLRDLLLAHLDEIVGRCAVRMPEVVVDGEAFVARLCDALLTYEGPVTLAALDGIAVDDLYLATALAAGDPGAIAFAERELVPVLRQAAVKIHGDRTFVDEIVQRARHKLFVADAGTKAGITKYRGTGPLTRWLRVVATRIAVDLKRTDNKLDNDDAIAELVAPDDPELALIWHTCADAYKRALAHALKLLPKRDRTLLRQRYVDGLELDALGKIHGAVASTMMRRLRKIEEQLAEATRERLKHELALTDSQLHSMERMVVGQLPMSLTRMLRAR